MIYDGEKGTYSSGLKPEEGDVVEISVSDSKKGYDLSACDTIPAKVRIENVTVMRKVQSIFTGIMTIATLIQ